MPSYWRLKFIKSAKDRNRIIENLELLRDQIKKEMPKKTANDTLILGTWNIRNFDDNRFGHGPRLEESFWYIAEIISAFDIIAVQEICDDIEPLENVMRLLDPEYDYIITDVTEGPSGNRERLGFVYNSEKVDFKGVAGEIVLPYKDLISSATNERQFARTPFSCSFQSGWFKFMFSTVHIYYGNASKSSPEYQRRIDEIDSVAKFLSKRADEDRASHILVGDFNIEDFDAKTFDALKKNGFMTFKNNIGSNSDQTKFYDQISFKTRENQLQLAKPNRPNECHGVLNIFERLMNDEQFAGFKDAVKATVSRSIKEAQDDLKAAERSKERARTESSQAKAEKKIDGLKKKIEGLKALRDNSRKLKAYFLGEWRTFQLSDHFPLWVELRIDFSSEYLDRLKKTRGESASGSILPS